MSTPEHFLCPLLGLGLTSESRSNPVSASHNLVALIHSEVLGPGPGIGLEVFVIFVKDLHEDT